MRLNTVALVTMLALALSIFVAPLAQPPAAAANCDEQPWTTMHSIAGGCGKLHSVALIAPVH